MTTMAKVSQPGRFRASTAEFDLEREE